MAGPRHFIRRQQPALVCGQHRLALDQGDLLDGHKVPPLLAELAGVARVERLPADPGRACYALTGTRPAEELAPVAAAAVARAGWNLYGLGPEARDLEKIFTDINLHGGREQ